jgi:hypothetical protein
MPACVSRNEGDVRGGALERGGPRPRGRPALERGGPRPRGCFAVSPWWAAGDHQGRNRVVRVFLVRGSIHVLRFLWVSSGLPLVV